MTTPRRIFTALALSLAAAATSGAERDLEQRIATLDTEADALARQTLRLDELRIREEIAELWGSSPEAHTRGVVSALHDLASLYMRVGPLEAAETALREAIELRESLTDSGAPEVDTLLRQLDTTLERLRPDDPERETILLRLTGSAPKTEDLNRLARYWRERGETEREVETLERALAHEAASSASENRWTGVLLADLGRAQEEAGRLDRAESAYRRAVDVAERAFGSRHPQLVRPLATLGTLHAEAGRHEEAAPLLERAYEIDLAAWGEKEAACDCACTASLRELLEETYRALGREEDLRRLPPARSAEARTASETADEADSARVSDLRRRGRIREALEQAELDVALARGRDEGDSRGVAERLRTVAWLLVQQGRGAEALDRVREALGILEGDAEARPGRLADLYLLAGNAVASVDAKDGETDEFLRKELDVRLALGHRQRAAVLLQQLGTRKPAADRGAEELKALEGALALWHEMADSRAPEAVTIRTEIALTHLARERYDEAERWIGELLSVAERQTAYRSQRIREAAQRFEEQTGREVGSPRGSR